MARSLKGERYVVFGGSGSIGRGIVAALLEQGASVVSASLSYRKATERLADLRREYGAQLGIGVADVTNDSSMYCFCASLRDAEHSPPVHGIIYAVGNCPPTSFDQAVGTQLTYLVLDELRSELNMHVVGLLSVARMFKWLEADSAVVVIGSAVTRLTDDKCPSWLHAGHYAVAKAAQKELVVWLRRDPIVKGRQIRIHYLAPAAVDTPFHQGCQHQPLAMLSVHQVAHRVLEALQSDTIIDEMMLPAAPAK